MDLLGTKLRSLQMIELLEELVALIRAEGGPGRAKAAGLLMEARIARAIGTADQQQRDKLFDEVIAKQDKLLETLKTADKPADKMVRIDAIARRLFLDLGDNLPDDQFVQLV